MRRIIVTVCAVALVACSDRQNLAAPVMRKPLAGHIDSAGSSARVDPKSVAERMGDLMGAGFGKVVLPADGFSLSPDAVHPDMACQQTPWNGARCWLMYTPYKGSDPSFENPAFLQAANDTSWTTPPSVANPIVEYPGFGAYNSDPDQAFEPHSSRLVQVYRVVADSFNKIMIMSTTNARTWTTAKLAFKERNHDAISPSLVIDPDRSANLWYVRSGTEGCNSTSSSVVMRTATPTATERVEDATWSPAVAVKLSIPNAVIWHLDVAPLPDDRGYVALVVAYSKGTSCGASDLWLATSVDGISWRTFAMPVLWRGMTLARKRTISTWYRGTLRYDAATDDLHIWPSGLAGPAWTIYHTSVKLADILGLLDAAQPGELKTLFSSEASIRATIPMP